VTLDSTTGVLTFNAPLVDTTTTYPVTLIALDANNNQSAEVTLDLVSVDSTDDAPLSV